MVQYSGTQRTTVHSGPQYAAGKRGNCQPQNGQFRHRIWEWKTVAATPTRWHHTGQVRAIPTSSNSRTQWGSSLHRAARPQPRGRLRNGQTAHSSCTNPTETMGGSQKIYDKTTHMPIPPTSRVHAQFRFRGLLPAVLCLYSMGRLDKARTHAPSS